MTAGVTGTWSIEESLDRWVAAHYGATATIERLRRLPGHSGITFAFDVQHGPISEGIVLRVPPRGVRHQANLDVLRLAAPLTLAAEFGVPVPAVRWHGSDEEWFGTPYLMVERVDGTTLPDIFEPTAGPFPERNEVDALFRQAINALVAIHRVDIGSLLSTGWAVPQSVREDIDQWMPLLHKSESDEEIRRTLELRDLLLVTAPADDRVTLVHGDFYSNNWLFNDGRLTAVLDWENTTLNRPMWDLGWLATLYDPECWAPGRASTMGWNPRPEDFYDWYETASGAALVDPDWYQALMCYRLASITPSKVRLHRTGRRVDPIWEIFAEAIPFQLDKAFGLLGRRM